MFNINYISIDFVIPFTSLFFKRYFILTACLLLLQYRVHTYLKQSIGLKILTPYSYNMKPFFSLGCSKSMNEQFLLSSKVHRLQTKIIRLVLLHKLLELFYKIRLSDFLSKKHLKLFCTQRFSYKIVWTFLQNFNSRTLFTSVRFVTCTNATKVCVIQWSVNFANLYLRSLSLFKCQNWPQALGFVFYQTFFKTSCPISPHSQGYILGSLC